MKRVLLVDDNAALRRLVKLSLLQRYAVFEAANGEDALSCAGAVRPDLAVIDIGLPGAMDGLGLIRELRQMPGLGDLLIVILSGSGRSDLSATPAVNAIFAKPFRPLALADCVEHLLSSQIALRVEDADE
jgi:CheY-like chemotaxis protein